MSAAPEPLTAEEIAGIRSRCVFDAVRLRTDTVSRLCDAAESAAAKDAEIAANVDLMERLLTQIGDLRQRVERAEADAARYRWARPILNGDDDEETDRRALLIGRALVQRRDIDDAIDTAIAAAQPATKERKS